MVTFCGQLSCTAFTPVFLTCGHYQILYKLRYYSIHMFFVNLCLGIWTWDTENMVFKRFRNSGVWYSNHHCILKNEDLPFGSTTVCPETESEVCFSFRSINVFLAWLIFLKSRSPVDVNIPVAVPGKGDAIDELGSIDVTFSPAKFLAKSESDIGVYFSRVPAILCFRFRASPNSGKFAHSSTDTFDWKQTIMVWRAEQY